jgi:hypothetical protein
MGALHNFATYTKKFTVSNTMVLVFTSKNGELFEAISGGILLHRSPVSEG